MFLQYYLNEQGDRVYTLKVSPCRSPGTFLAFPYLPQDLFQPPAHVLCSRGRVSLCPWVQVCIPLVGGGRQWDSPGQVGQGGCAPGLGWDLGVRIE